MPEKSGVVGGNIEAVPAGEGADRFVVIRKKKTLEGKGEEKK